ncbi:hypothetical protein [Terricaulis silvestris]|uniref:Uncharacterized protein n=1 Tax=Terricaulis silvestris TaxID=2686094 RepID=A0A6I6MIW8_9CAUL|nr:hypothetical protein [Terricaulis silvestris]QGZ93741.1 hypothetical protein DSM104635_00553 [Terricaulis silvestris]
MTGADWTVVLAAPLIGVAVIAVWDAVSAWTKALTEEKRDGNWRDRTYTFNDKVIFTTTVRAEDNGKPIPFKVTQGDWGSYVTLRWDALGRDEVWCRIEAQATPMPPIPWIPGGWPELQSLLMKDRAFNVITHMPRPGNAVQVEVRLLRWHASTPTRRDATHCKS